MANKKKEMRNPLQEAFNTLKESTAEEYVDILKDEWNEMLERGREPIIEFDNGDYYYIEPDWENKRFYAGHAFNAGIMREIGIPMEPNMNLDEHIAELFDTAIDLDPSLLVDDDWNDPDTEVEFVNIGEDLIKEGFPTDDELMAEIKRNNEEGIKKGSAKEFSDILFDTIMGNTRYPNIDPDLIDDAEDNEVDSNAHWMTINYGGHKYKINVELVESKKSPKGKKLKEATENQMPEFVDYNETKIKARDLWNGRGPWSKMADYLDNLSYDQKSPRYNLIAHQYYRYYNDGDIPNWVNSKPLKPTQKGKFGKELTADGELELEKRAVKALVNEFRKQMSRKNTVAESKKLKEDQMTPEELPADDRGRVGPVEAKCQYIIHTGTGRYGRDLYTVVFDTPDGPRFWNTSTGALDFKEGNTYTIMYKTYIDKKYISYVREV